MTTPALSMHSICDPITCNVGLMQSNLGKVGHWLHEAKSKLVAYYGKIKYFNASFDKH